jgi:hypothetical protein
MTKRSSHAGKSSRQRGAYIRQLHLLGSESTVEEQPIFSLSDSLPSPDDFEHEPTPTKGQRRRRRRPSASSVTRYLKDNWIGLLIPIIALFLVVFIYNQSRDIGNLQGVVSEIKSAVNSLTTQLQNMQTNIHEQDMELQRQSIELEHMKNDSQESNK